jgi:hypothetical protein
MLRVGPGMTMVCSPSRPLRGASRTIVGRQSKVLDMLFAVVEGLLGCVLALVTLRDVFATVVVPGRTPGVLKVSRRLVFLALPVWKRLQPRGIGVTFAPLLMVAGFLVWVVLLVIAFGLMAHALRGWFRPAIAGFGEALYLSGSVLATIGLGTSDAFGPAAVLVVAAGFCGLAVMTMGVTYLLEVQANIALRDTGVLKITTTAGQTPSAIGLLEKYAAIGCRGELPDVLRHARDWSAGMLQSHASHPWLIYFRSAGVGAGWPATLGALVDLALVLELLVDEPGTAGLAVLAREEADRVARELGKLVGLQPVADTTTPADVQALCARLEQAGYRLRPGRNLTLFLHARGEHSACVEALSHHLGTPHSPLVNR